MRNMANWDRLVRLVIVAVIGADWYTGVISGTLALVLGVMGAVLLLTSVISFCPLYSVLNLSTARKG